MDQAYPKTCTEIQKITNKDNKQDLHNKTINIGERDLQKGTFELEMKKLEYNGDYRQTANKGARAIEMIEDGEKGNYFRSRSSNRFNRLELFFSYLNYIQSSA